MEDRTQAASLARDSPQKQYNTLSDEAAVADVHKATKKPKRPRRVLHFSDGTMEEYSTDDEEEEEERRRKEEEKKKQVVDPKSLTWLPWFWYVTWMMGSNTLAVCDSVGEKLAWWFGITSPKYYYEIQEAKRMIEEEKKRKERMDAEMAGWVKKSDDDDSGEPIQGDVSPAPEELRATTLSEKSQP